MSYPNALGEFIVQHESHDWPKTIRYIERRPIQTRGLLNPWEQERTRVLWVQEQAVWAKIIPLKSEYAAIEKRMEQDVSIFNSHLIELERVTKKKTGLGPIGSYGGMALAVLPGFGWAAAVFSAVSMLFEMIGGNKKKKRIRQLMQIMESAHARLTAGQQRLVTIQDELKALVDVTQHVKKQQALQAQHMIQVNKLAHAAKEELDKGAFIEADKFFASIRQISPKRVDYAQEL